MTKRACFTKKFEQEAVRLAETNGRTRKEVAEDRVIGLSTLNRWLSRNRDAGVNDTSLRKSEEHMAAELKRLRRENEILCQERDVLKKATVDSTSQCNII
ncbi:transposase [Paenochrobactrum pullorum]|uniref:transposase n=1 Tax=Paenochrobactrum pullorum TaxID=1324351 RepID=UPI0035BC5D49